jgi:hypothetical protein
VYGALDPEVATLEQITVPLYENETFPGTLTDAWSETVAL